MSEDSFQEKTQQPTPRRRQKAREEGQVPRSRDLNSALILVSAALLFLALGHSMTDSLKTIMKSTFEAAGSHEFEPALLVAILKQIAISLFVHLGPFFVVLVIVTLAGPIALGGLSLQLKPIMPKLNRISPGSGLKRLFSLRSLVETIKSLARLTIILLVMWSIMRTQFAELMTLSTTPLNLAVAKSSHMLLGIFLILTLTLILFAVLDVPYQLWEHTRSLKMTHQDIKEEQKSTEGSPESKQHIKQQQQRIANMRMMTEIPKANVIITNPEHYAVALRYDDGGAGAPKVVAKGVDLMAQQIQKVANAHRVPIIRTPPLARSLYYHTELFEEIPAGLYNAVAKILAYLYQLRRYHAGFANLPSLPVDLEIPKALQRDAKSPSRTLATEH